jgi:uncharacterized membrane protein
MHTPVRYPNAYVWLVFVSAMDIMLTWIVLAFGGWEANIIAARVLDRWGLPGMVVFKFAIIFLVICLCEFIGHRDDAAGRRLAHWGVGLSCIPIVLAFYLLFMHR